MTSPIDFSTFVAHWRDIEGDDDNHYDGSDELQTISASFGTDFGLMRLGIHHERLKPGRRVSWPHAEADEEEFVFVLEGEPERCAEQLRELFAANRLDGLTIEVTDPGAAEPLLRRAARVIESL